MFAAKLPDFEYANAFLLGLDIGNIATREDPAIVASFLNKQISSEEQPAFDHNDPYQTAAIRYQSQLQAFRKGFAAGHQ